VIAAPRARQKDRSRQQWPLGYLPQEIAIKSRNGWLLGTCAAGQSRRSCSSRMDVCKRNKVS
jgi:hypothetical protein